MLTFKVTTVGASAGFILTKEAMARLKVQKGDTLYLTEAPEGGYRLKFDPADAVRTMETVAAGALDEAALGEWFRQRIVE